MSKCLKFLLATSLQQIQFQRYGNLKMDTSSPPHLPQIHRVKKKKTSLYVVYLLRNVCFFLSGNRSKSKKLDLTSPEFLHQNTIHWLVLGDEQMSKGWPFSLLNDEQMSNWLGVEHQPAKKRNKIPEKWRKCSWNWTMFFVHLPTSIIFFGATVKSRVCTTKMILIP